MEGADSTPLPQSPVVERPPLQETLDDRTTGPQPALIHERDLGRGTTLGRYILLERLGQGGMGLVFAAYDPDLDRRVALKLLLASSPGSHKAHRRRARLLREAQAMARLTHPNVITVHDVGTFGDRVFIAMEFVEGSTLADWLRAEQRSVPDVLDAFTRAGRGLTAAHAAGVIHRDFKPENVLRGVDGRVCVVDFGIARDAGARDPSDSSTGTVRRTPDPLDDELRSGASASTSGRLLVTPSDSVLGEPLTRTGALMGTPAYMSPEQHLSQAADARSDQFSFCVALYEGLYGERPFPGETHASLAFNIANGRMRPAPRDGRVPGWVRRAVLRGLSIEPQDRFPSMDALLQALGRDLGFSRLRWVAAAGVGALVTLGAVAYGQAIDPGHTLCEGAEAQLAPAWPDRREAVAGAFAATDKPFAKDVLRAIEPKLDRYAEAWIAMRTETCEATHVRGEQSADLLDRRMYCLDRRLDALAALTDVFAAADAEVAEHAVDAVDELPIIDDCTDTEALRLGLGPAADPQVRSRVTALAQLLAQARALGEAGRPEAGIAIVETVIDGARAIPYPSLAAEALLVLADLHNETGQPIAAEATAREAIYAAELAGQDRLAAEAWMELLWVSGYQLAKVEDGRRAAKHAAALLERVGQGGVLEARLVSHLGDLHDVAGDYAAALEHHQRALELRRALGGDESADMADSHNGIGNALLGLGRYEEALVAYQRSLAMYESTLGASHPQVAMLLSNVGIAHDYLGRYDQAIVHHERALLIARAAQGRDHPDLESQHTNLGAAYYAIDRHSLAREHYEQAILLLEAGVGREHPSVATVLDNLSLVALAEDAADEAVALMREAVAIRKRTQGPEHPDYAESLNNLGYALVGAKRYRDAHTQHVRALEIYESAFGPDHPNCADTHGLLGDLFMEQGRARVARTHHERALEIRSRTYSDAHPELADSMVGIAQADLALAQYSDASERLEAALEMTIASPQHKEGSIADIRFLLARAAWGQGDPDRALALAREARTGLDEFGDRFATERTEIDDWLDRRDHRGRRR